MVYYGGAPSGANFEARRGVPAMFEEALSAAIRLVRGYTAVRAWAVEVLAVFVLLTVVRFGLAVWMFDTAASGAGAGYVPGWVPAAAAVGLVAGEAGLGAGGAPWWVAWLYAYDNLRAYAESAIILGVIFAFVLEGGIMFLARKRIRLSKEEGREEGREEARAEVQPQLDAAEATAAQAQAAADQATAQLEAAQAEIRELREQQAQQDAENRELRERQSQRDEEFRQLLERQATRDEEIRQFLEQLAQRQNGGSNAG